MEQYPGRVFSKPEFTALPACIFSGAEFSLIPSRDEPFGLVAVEFGRKGALGVGARVGGLGNMPGWWYTIESPATKHLLHQFKGAINAALSTKPETRATMRARSRLQRFPVAQWIEDLETLQSKSIALHARVANRGRSMLRFSGSGRASPAISTAPGSTAMSSAQNTAPNTAPNSEPPSRAHSPSREAVVAGPHGQVSLGRWFGPSNPESSPRGRSRSSSRSRLSKRMTTPTRTSDAAVATNRVSVVHEGNEDLGIPGQRSSRLETTHEAFRFGEDASSRPDTADGTFPPRFPPLAQLNMPGFSPVPSGTSTPTADGNAIPRSEMSLSLNSVAGEKKAFKLQKVHPLFTDNTGTYYRAFQEKLSSVNSKTSEDRLCIEEYLVKSEKAWFNRFHHAQMGNSAAASRSATPASSVFRMPWGRASQDIGHVRNRSSDSEAPSDAGSGTSEFLLGDDYKPPTGLKRFLQKKVGDWYLYTFLLAFVGVWFNSSTPTPIRFVCTNTVRDKSSPPILTRSPSSLAKTDSRPISCTL